MQAFVSRRKCLINPYYFFSFTQIAFPLFWVKSMVDFHVFELVTTLMIPEISALWDSIVAEKTNYALLFGTSFSISREENLDFWILV